MKNRPIFFLTLAGCVGFLIWAIYAWAGQMTLTTYYPAPTGNYVNLTVTGNTYLATSSGNVGIRTSSPQAPLHVGPTTTEIPAAGTQGGNIVIERGDNNLGLFFGLNGAGNGWLQAQRTDFVAYNSILLNPNGGNVGIGMTNPVRTLDVAGEGKFGGTTIGNLYLYNASSSLGAQIAGATGNTFFAINGGNVGIGAVSPGAPLEVYGANGGYLGYITGGGTNDSRFALRNGATQGQIEMDIFGGASPYAYIQTGKTTNVGLQFGASSYVFNTGNVGIGNTNPANLLTMEASGGGYYSQVDHQWHNGSSIKLKQDITTGVIDPFKILNQVNIVNYRYKSEVKDNPKAPYHIGFIAEKTPELLSGKEKNGMSTGDTIGLLLAVVKQQQKEIENLRQEVEQLKHATH